MEGPSVQRWHSTRASRRSYDPSNFNDFVVPDFETKPKRKSSSRNKKRHSLALPNSSSGFNEDVYSDYGATDDLALADIRRASSLRYSSRRKSEQLHQLKTKSHYGKERSKKVGRRSDSGCLADLEQTKQEEMKEIGKMYLDTKTEMLQIIEEDLELKLEIRSIKEGFLEILKSFKAMEQRHYEWEFFFAGGIPQSPDQSLSFTQDSISSLPCAPHQSLADDQTSFWDPNYLPARQDCSGQNETDLSIVKPKPALPDESNLSRMPSDRSLKDLSQITKYSQQSMREQYSQSNLSSSGPLQSTISYPQSSTPEHIRQLRESARIELEDEGVKLDDSSLACPPDLGDRPKPTGIDNRHTNGGFSAAGNTAPPLTTIPILPVTPKMAHNNSSSAESTPIVYRPRLPVNNRKDLLRSGNDSGPNCIDSSPTIINTSREMSRSRFLLLEDSSDFSSSSRSVSHAQHSHRSCSSDSDSKPMKRQTALSDLEPDYDREVVGLSESALAHYIPQGHPVPIHYSLEATRESAPDLSNLSSAICDDDPRSSDVTSASPMTSYTDSSYKESDWSATNNTGFSIGTDRSSNHWPSTDNLHAPAPNNIESNPGFRAPMNSPNVTGTDASSSSRPLHDTQDSRSSLDSSDFGRQPYSLGTRPPCIGGETSFYRSKSMHANRRQQTNIGEESTDTSPPTDGAYSRTYRPCMNERELIPINATVFNTPGSLKNACGVKRTLSKHIKSLGKNLRGHFKDKSANIQNYGNL